MSVHGIVMLRDFTPVLPEHVLCTFRRRYVLICRRVAGYVNLLGRVKIGRFFWIVVVSGALARLII